MTICAGPGGLRQDRLALRYVFGAQAAIFGYEVDGPDSTFAETLHFSWAKRDRGFGVKGGEGLGNGAVSR